MSFDVDTIKHSNKLNVDQLYLDTPLGTIGEVVDADERRHLELMGKEVLSEQEAQELDLLTDQFITTLNDQVSKIIF